MKTLKEVKKMRDDLLKRHKEEEDFKLKKGEINKLNEYILYLENNPSEEYLKKERQRINNRLKLIQDGFTDWAKDQSAPTLKKLKDEFNKINEVPKLRRQLKNIGFLLAA